MPSYARVEELIAYVEQGRFMEALREFYHAEAAMQENDAPPRQGLAACLESEAQFLASVETFHEIRAASFLVDGDRVAIRWIFEATLQGDRRVRRDEIAYQRWEGEKILCERFFYDAAQPSPSAQDVREPEAETLDLACVVVGRQGELLLPEALLRSLEWKPGNRLLVTGTPQGLCLRAVEGAPAARKEHHE